jgi:hypothetical protein
VSKTSKMLTYGAVVATLYGLPYVYNEEVVAISRHGPWWFVLPVTMAFVVSFFRGHFTGPFRNGLGVQPKKPR